MKNLLATLLLSQGTPMLLAGDEFGRTQRGNNNAYCQDSEISWVDWGAIGAREQALIAFVRRLARLRERLPVLRRNRFLTDERRGDIRDVTWLAPDGDEMTTVQWEEAQTRCFGMLLDGRAPVSAIARPSTDASVLLVFNAWREAVEFTLPPSPVAASWVRLIDTTLVEQAAERFDAGHVYAVTARSLLLLASAGPGQALASVEALATED
jgi:glycogen operon protein